MFLNFLTKGVQKVVTENLNKSVEPVINTKEEETGFLSKSLFSLIIFLIVLIGVVWISLKELLKGTYSLSSNNLYLNSIGVEGVLLIIFISFCLIILLEMIARKIGFSAAIRSPLLLLALQPVRELFSITKGLFYNIELRGEDFISINVYGFKALINRIWTREELSLYYDQILLVIKHRLKEDYDTLQIKFLNEDKILILNTVFTKKQLEEELNKLAVRRLEELQQMMELKWYERIYEYCCQHYTVILFLGGTAVGGLLLFKTLGFLGFSLSSMSVHTRDLVSVNREGIEGLALLNKSITNLINVSQGQAKVLENVVEMTTKNSTVLLTIVKELSGINMDTLKPIGVSLTDIFQKLEVLEKELPNIAEILLKMCTALKIGLTGPSKTIQLKLIPDADK